MSEYNIFRPLTDAEKQNIIPLSRKRPQNIRNIFLGDLAKQQQIYQKQYIPFDTYGALIDFDEKYESKINEARTTLDLTNFNPNVEFSDFKEYANPSIFIFEEVTEDRVAKLVAGIKTEVVIGMRYHFKTKKRGNKLSIFVPNEEKELMDKYIEDNYTNKKKKVKDITTIHSRAISEITDTA